MTGAEREANTASYLEGTEFFSVGTCKGCAECGDVNPESGDEGSFSWSGCETCGSSLGGDRYAAHGYVRIPQTVRRYQSPYSDKPAQTYVRKVRTLVHFDVCADCLQYFANGEPFPENE